MTSEEFTAFSGSDDRSGQSSSLSSESPPHPLSAESSADVSQFRALFEAALDPITIANHEARYVDVNPAACDLLGVVRDDLIGRNIRDFLDPNFEFVAAWDAFLRQGHAKGEICLYRPDGTVRIVEYSATANFAPDLHLSVLRDVTERKQMEAQLKQLNHELAVRVEQLQVEVQERQQAEAALQVREERYALAVRAGQVGVWDWDIRTNAVYIDPNLKLMLGYREDEIANQIEDWQRIIHPEDREPTLQAIREHLQGNTPEYQIEHRMRHKDGSYHWFLTRGVALRDTQGVAYRLMGTRTDISDRKQAEVSTQQAIQWEQLIRRITQRIRESLNLDQILETAVNEVRQMLAADRALIFRLHDDASGQVIKESVLAEFPVTDSMLWLDEFFTEECCVYYRQGLPRIVPDVTTDDWGACIAEFMQAIGVKSKIVAPILWGGMRQEVNRRDTATPPYTRVWGLLIVHACTQQRQWHPAEAELLQQTANQLAIAIHQADLYQRLQTELNDRRQAELAMQHAMEREQKIRERERFIAAIAHNIRRSLDLNQILMTTVEEVQQFLQVERVVIYRFNPDWSGCVIAESCTDEMFSIQDQEIYDPCFADAMVHPYRQGRIHAVNDVLAEDLDPCYVNLLLSLNVRAVLVIPILVGQELWGLMVAHQCTGVRQWQQLSWHLLRQLSTQLAMGIYQAELYLQTQQQAQRERMLNRIIQSVRNSLDLDTVFNAATAEIATLLQLDRAEIVQYFPERGIWCNVASYRCSTDLPDALGLIIPDENNWIAERLKRLEVVQVHDYGTQADAANQQFTSDYPGAWLLIPLQTVSDTAGVPSAIVWGSLSLNHRRYPHYWQDWEIQLTHAVANQLAIAIQQSELYREVHQLNDALEDQVQTRTAQLRQALDFEALLKRMTDKVRDSLDESQILQTAVQELALYLRTYCCDTGLYDLEQGTSTVRYEYVSLGVPYAQGTVFRIEDYEDIYSQLLRGEHFQSCRLAHPLEIARNQNQRFAILACPLMDDQGVIGDMWLYRPADSYFEEAEIRLVQQVADQCAIALRQSRLYQAAQRDVEELERVNRLKDDFLSTVSHELRTPMSNIKMAIQMLDIQLKQLNILGNEATPISRYFQILQDESQREINLINNLLDLSRLDAGVEPPLLTVVDLPTWIPQVAESFVTRTRTQQQQLEIDVPENFPLLVTDLSHLERIFTELLQNACKYTPRNETITIRVRQIDQTDEPPLDQIGNATVNAAVNRLDNRDLLEMPICLIEIINSGVEIPAQERRRIFDKFYRVPSNDPWKHGGTGLGLALVKRLIENLSGNITVESRNNTTCFRLVFPMRSLPVQP